MSSHTPPRDRLRSLLLLVLGMLGLGLLLSACSDAQAASTREVLIDYDHDEFAGSFLGNFPHEVRVHPGMSLRFKQAWTGEPHSITGGRLVDEAMSVAVPLFEKYQGTPFSEIPPEDFQAAEEQFENLFWMLSEEEFESSPVNQNVAQPCYRREGGPPEDPSQPCPDEEQEQPAFDGSFDWYNSGFIPYEGPKGNRFDLTLAEDIDPGTYYFYCAVHGPLQYSKVVVVPEDAPIPTQAEVARQAREEIESWAQPLLESFREAQSAEEQITVEDPYMGEELMLEKPLAGFMTEDPWVHGFVSEFVPRDMTVEVGQQVTWSFVGPHTVSFKVPSYFSQMEVQEDGTVVFSPDALLPRNSPAPPEPPEPPEGEEGEGPGDGPPPPPPVIDAGEWDGEEFTSSGIVWEGTWSITFAEPGTYNYACLIHPKMVGTVTVEA